MENLNRKKIRETILKGVEDVLDRAESQYDTASEKSSEIFGDIKERASSAYDSAAEKAARTKEETVKYVHKHPEESLLIAAGIGALTALLAARFMKKR